MRILVDNGGYELLNHGDIAMLQIAVQRLKHLWPDAHIEVLTTRPDRLAMYCPEVHALLVQGRSQWFADSLFAPLHSFSPNMSMENVSPSALLLASGTMRTLRRLSGRNNCLRDAFHHAITHADLVIASGGGYLTDAFSYHAHNILRTLHIAKQLGKATAMLSQGIGPIDSRSLRDEVGSVLSIVDLIALRESRIGPALLDSYGVSSDRVIVTGDDAIEMAYSTCSQKLGTAIGINMRVTDYSAVENSMLQVVRSVLHDAANNYSVPLIPLPISFNDSENTGGTDIESIRQLLLGFDDTSNGGAHLRNPIDVITEIGRCRIVVTGSYHAAVFALSQGIPAICLAQSAYYIDKFSGLSDQFDGNCLVVHLQSENIEDELRDAISTSWKSAESLRTPLITAAKRQIDQGNAFYNRLYHSLM